MKKILLTATVQSHIAQFHKPLMKMLKEYGYEIHVAARDNLNEKNGLKLENADEVYDIPFHRSPFKKSNLNAYKQLKKIITKNHYDIIHCNTPMGGILTRMAAKKERKNGTKVFYTAHGFHFYNGAPKKNWLMYYPIEKYFARYTDKLITISKEDYFLANKKFKTQVYHVHGVGAYESKYFAISEDEINSIKTSLGYEKKKILILCAGELNQNKNQTTVIKAFSLAVKNNPNMKLLIAGNGPMDKTLKKIVQNMGLISNVDFLGYRTDLHKYMKICSLVISASFREGLPLNIMEAMLCKKAVICSFNRGHQELVKNNKTGYLVKAESEVDFAECITKLSNDIHLLREFGENGYNVVQPFVTKNVLLELQKVYEVE